MQVTAATTQFDDFAGDDKKLDLGEFTRVCEKLGMVMDVDGTVAAFDAIDVDDSGVISRDEFSDFMDSSVTKVRNSCTGSGPLRACRVCVCVSVKVCSKLQIKHRAGDITAEGFVRALSSVRNASHLRSSAI